MRILKELVKKDGTCNVPELVEEMKLWITNGKKMKQLIIDEKLFPWGDMGCSNERELEIYYLGRENFIHAFTNLLLENKK